MINIKHIHTIIDVIKDTLTLITVIVLLITLSIGKLIYRVCAMLKYVTSNSLAFFNGKRMAGLVSEGVGSNLRDSSTLYNKIPDIPIQPITKEWYNWYIDDKEAIKFNYTESYKNRSLDEYEQDSAMRLSLEGKGYYEQE